MQIADGVHISQEKVEMSKESKLQEEGRENTKAALFFARFKAKGKRNVGSCS